MRKSGVLLHPTSLPGGTLGPAAYAFVDWLHAADCTLWQVLPLTIAGAGKSPYSSPSALAMDPAFTDPTDKTPLDAAAFEAREPWVRNVARFLALKAAHKGAPWWEWSTEVADTAEVERHIEAQARVDAQWQKLKHYAESKGVQIIGDMPIYVDRDSCDVWTSREQFQLDSKGAPLAVSGVPPDYFSETGQLWGNPLYDWTAQAKDGHRFWVERLKRALTQTPIVRIDHFRGFSAYWSIPPDAKDARAGVWKTGPGEALFKDLTRALGPLPIIAEDLGSLDEAVHSLRKAVGLPGMYVLQFAFGGDATNTYLPHNHGQNAVAYTGTHDNDTTLGFWNSTDEKTRDHIRHYFGVDGHDIVWTMIRAALASPAQMAIFPMQDVLQLGSEARMNTPSKPSGNWEWQMPSGALQAFTAGRLKQLNALYGRGRNSVASIAC